MEMEVQLQYQIIFYVTLIKVLNFPQKINLPKVISLTNSIELITAISNDLGYDKVFENQLENFSKIEIH